MKAVLDTNVLVSGIICAEHAPGRIVDAIRAGILQVVVDDRILAEYRDVLRRPGLRPWIEAADAEDLLAFLATEAERVVADVFVTDLTDPGDIPFLEVALAAGVPLVTGNVRHFPPAKRRGCQILDPSDYLRLFLA